MSKHTPPPWRWQLNPDGRALTLFGRKSLVVMDFVRWGMSRATARFRNDECLMEKADAFGVVIVGEEHHASWNQSLAHPDAQLIAAAPQLLEAAKKMSKASVSPEPQDWSDALDELDAAIAGAEGQA